MFYSSALSGLALDTEASITDIEDLIAQDQEGEQQLKVRSQTQFRPPIALHTDLSRITTELWEIAVLRMAH